MGTKSTKKTKKPPQLPRTFTVRVSREDEQKILELSAEARRRPAEWLRLECILPALERFSGKAAQ